MTVTLVRKLAIHLWIMMGALVAGALYFNTTDNVMKVYEGSSWVAAYASLSGALLAANNLSDVSSVSSARTNLGLGTGDSPTLTGLQVDDVNGAEIIISRNDTSLVSGDFIGGIKFGTNDSSTAYGTPPHYSAGIKAKASGTVGLMDMHLYAGQTNDAYEEDTPSMTLGYNGDIYFYEDTGTTAKLTWDASAERLGIGTSSVDSVLHIASESNGTNTFTMESLDAFLSSTQEANAIHFKTNDSSASGVTGKISQISENGNEKLALAFSTFNGTLSERLRIDSSGNVGIGTSSPAYKLDVAGSADVARFDTTSLGGVLFSRANLVGNNSTHYKIQFVNSDSTVAEIKTTNRTGGTASTGTSYELSFAAAGTGYQTWFTNSTERMRLDSSGNLLVGGTSAKGQITSIKSSSTTTFSSLGHGMLGLQNTSSTNNNYTWMNFYESNGNYVGAIGTLNEVHASASTSVKGSLVFATKQSGVGGYPVERLRIDSSGDFLVKTIDARIGSDVGAVEYGTSTANSVKFYSSDSERMRIDSSGNVGIGTSSPDTRLTVLKNSNADFSSQAALRASSLQTFSNSSVTTAVVFNGTSGNSDKFISVDNAGGTQFFSLGYQNGATRRNVIQFDQNNTIYLSTAGTERARITSAGDLLVGTTDSDIPGDSTGSGVVLKASGRVDVTRNGILAYFNRTTSDGALVEFRKDGTTVGTISAIGGELTIDATSGTNKDVNINGKDAGGNTRGLHIGSGSVRPNADNSIDLATTSNRFKDLYLSGKITNNGTGGINIATSGNVGIGTTSMTRFFNLYDTTTNAQTAYFKSTQASGGAGFVAYNNNGEAATFQINGSSNTSYAGANSVNIGSFTNNTLAFLTNNTERMRIDTSGNVGIGTTSPSSRLHTYTSSGGNKLIVEAGAASQQAVVSLVTNATTPGQCQIYMGKSSASTNGQVGYDPNSDFMYFYTSNSEKMRIDSSGNVGIGTSSPVSTAKTSIKQAAGGGAGSTQLHLEQSNTTDGYDLKCDSADGALAFLRYASGSATERMRITSGGNLQLGTTTGGYRLNVTSNGGTTVNIRRDTNTGGLVDFNYGATGVGSISTNGTTTAYNTSSDYRLKEDIAPMTGALAKVAAAQALYLQVESGRLRRSRLYRA
jgi:hypothetical protein